MSATIYHVDPQRGDDAAAGTSPAQAWRSFVPLNRLRLGPGDRVEINPGAFAESLQPAGKGTPENPIVIRFAPGEFDFFPEHALKQALHISNTNDAPYVPKAIAMAFVNVQHLRIEGGAANGTKSDVFVRGPMLYFFFDGAADVQIRGLAFDYRRPTTSEYTLVEMAADHAIIQVHPDSTYTLEDGKITWIGEGWQHSAPGRIQEVDPAERKLWRLGRGPSPLREASSIEELDPFRLRLTFAAAHDFAQGHIFQDRETLRDCVGCFARQSRDIRWQDVAFYYMHGLGLVSQYCENVSVERGYFAPRPGSGRTCACWADATHFSGCKGLVSVTDSTFCGLQDDPINVHGTYLRIVEKRGDHQLLVRFMHPQTFGFQAFMPGDAIEFVSRLTLCDYAAATVSAAEMLNDKEILLTLEEPVPAFGPDDVLDNLTWSPSIVVRGCVMEQTPVRGCLLSTCKPVLVEDNTFLKTAWSAILNETDCNKWFESGRLRDLTIRNNRFIQCGAPVIYFVPANETALPEEPVLRNIRIENNYFEMCNALAVSARSVRGLTITGNRFSGGGELPIHTEGCTEVLLADNTLNAAG